MSLALGDFVVLMSEHPVERAASVLTGAAVWPSVGGHVADVRLVGNERGVFIACRGDVRVASREGGRGGLGLAREPECGGGIAAPAGIADAIIQHRLDEGQWSPSVDSNRGRFVFVFWDAQTRTVEAFTDAFRTYPVYYAALPDATIVASDLRLVLAALDKLPDVDPVSIYHYLNFAYVPSPRSAVKGVAKLKPGFHLKIARREVTTRRVFDTQYAEDLRGDNVTLARDLREKIVSTVSGYRPGPESHWGAFLSGGTDSSSIAGILAKANGSEAVDSFSIGFAEAGYDEMSFSRIAARHFGLRPHELNVDEAQAVQVIPRLVSGFDEPFGNSSAIPTFYCADLARNAGKELLIAGDGGDEIFGGNERYAKDQIFGWYHRAPGIVRLAGRGVSAALSISNAHLANRVKNMIHRGNLPNPDRFYSDDSFASDHFTEMLTSDFRQSVNVDDSLQVQREIFSEAGTKSELHRLMYLDLKLTIAESDIVKVVRSARVAGVDVAFPYLDRSLVDYAGRFPEQYKVNRLKKRYLFKLAMEDILPIEIRKKKKQGFGLPVAVWLRRGGQMRELVNDVVLSDRALSRGYFEPAFIRRLFTEHEQGSWDYSSEIFRLLMLELWHREYMDRRA
jgi:asparagine synthase (glutamine-hydrolysing)